MTTQTKNEITREFIEKELRFYNTADIRSTLVLCGLLSAIFVPLSIVSVYGIISIFETLWIKIILSVLLGALISLPSWAQFLILIRILKERDLLQNGHFNVVVREVTYKDEKPVQRHTEKFLHFYGFKGISVGSVNYDLVSQGDEFYIVYYEGYNNIKLFYSLKMYDYIEK